MKWIEGFRAVLKAVVVIPVVWLARLFKRRQLWLISDRSEEGGDNGEVLFLYLRRHHPEIDVRFVVDGSSETARRLAAVGPVVPWKSWRRKITTLLADCLISSQAQDAFVNPFGVYGRWYRRQLEDKPFVFLQHGIIKDDMSAELNRGRRHISGFVTSSERERASILAGDYGYTAKQVWLTGLPRFDMLTAAPSVVGKRILVMPTWRLSLLDGQTGPNGEWRLKNGFQKSEFFRFYGGLLLDERLLDACRRHGYAISFVLHPNMLAAQSFFRSDDVVNVLNGNTPYGSLFLQGALLVTDYSSTAFDFAYLRKPVVYAHFDADSFFASGHTYKKGYFDYVRDGFGEVEYSLDATVARIIAYIKTGCAAKDEYLKRVDDFFAFHDGENCRRVTEHIFQLAGGAKTPPAKCR